MQTPGKALTSMALLAISATTLAVNFPDPEVVKLSENVYVLLGPIQHANKQNQG